MNLRSLEKKSSGIVYSCYHSLARDGEHFVPEHTLSYQIAGSLILHDGLREYPSDIGSFRFIRRNQLLKFIKRPPENGDFKSISIYLNQDMLKDFSIENKLEAKPAEKERAVVETSKSKGMEAYIQSLIAYAEDGSLEDEELVKVKIKEGILLLLQTNPELKHILFDFTEPHKIDLEAYMNQNYHFNVKIDRFAYLTGRSLATFKRDFEKIFHSSPRRWLLLKRLQQAHYLITVGGKKSSEIYLDLGFEDISHFSHAFKKMYGKSPSTMLQ